MKYSSQKKVLVIGKKNGILHWHEDVISCLPIDTRSSFSLNSFSLKGRLTKHLLGGDSSHHQDMMAKALRESINIEKPSIIYIIDRFYLSAKVNAAIANSGAKVAQWVGDKFDHRLALNNSVDSFFFTDTGLVKAALDMQLNCHYLPLAAHRPCIKLLPWEQRRTELLFVGAPSPSRIQLLEQINYPTLVIGPKWPQLRNSNLNISRKRISLYETRTLYSKHKFVLNHINNNNLVCGLPSRCFDATAHGACLLTDAVADLSLNFTESKEVVTYSQIDQLNSTIENLLQTPNRAEQIALAGQTRTLNEHLLEHRIYQMNKKLNN